MTVLYDNLAWNREILLDLPLREGTGIITHDVAKPHHPITLHNTPTWTTLDSGLGVITLDGSTEYLQCLAASCADLDFTSGDYSLAGWYYITSGGDDDKTLMARFLVDNNGWELYHYYNGILTLRHHHAAGASIRTGAYSQNWTFGKWWFVLVTRSGVSAQFYRGDVDSFAALTTSISAGGLIDPETCNQNFYAGTDGTGDNKFNGPFWRPRIWPRVLSEAEGQQIWGHEKRWFA